VREQVFWGWGEPGSGPELPERAGAFLREALGLPGGVIEGPVPLAGVRLRPPALSAAARRGLEAAVGAAHVLDDPETRVLRCRGKSYLDLLAQRSGDCESAPDAVVRPAGHDEVAAVLAVCAEAGVAVLLGAPPGGSRRHYAHVSWLS